MKEIYKNWLKGFAVLFSLSAIISGILSCTSDSGEFAEILKSDLVTLRILPQKSASGAYQFVEYVGLIEPDRLPLMTTTRIEGFDAIYVEGTEYVISARKYTNEETGKVTYNYISTLKTD